MKTINYAISLLLIQSIIANAQYYSPTPTPPPKAARETPTATPTLTFTPTEWPTPLTPWPTWNPAMPANGMIVTDNQYTFDDLGGWVDYDGATDRELVLRWNPSESEKSNPDIVDYHVHLSLAKKEYQYLGHTNTNRPPYIFIWKTGTQLTTQSFRYGPVFGNLYSFHVFPVTKRGIMAGIGYYTYYPVTYEKGDVEAPLPTFTPTPPFLTTPTRFIAYPPVHECEVAVTDDRYSTEYLHYDDYDTEEEKELAIWWEKSGDGTYFQEFQIFVMVDKKDRNNPEYLGSQWSIERPFHFIWEPDSPMVNLKFRNGPEFGHTYGFFVYHVDYTGKRWGPIEGGGARYWGPPYPTFTPTATITPTYTITPTFTPTVTHSPTASPIVLKSMTAVHVYDEPGATDDLTGKNDFDAPDAVNLTIAWDSDISDVQGWDIYVRQDGLGYQFLTRCVTDARSWDWHLNAPNVDPLYQNGPQFNHAYQFRVYPLGIASGPRIILEQSAPVRMIQEGEEPAPMPTIPMPDVPAGRVIAHTNLMTGNIHPPMDWLSPESSVSDGRSILIAWNFGEDSSLIKNYHVRVTVNEMIGHDFLGSTGSGEIRYFEWSPKSQFFISPAYREGPQKGKCYRFRVVGFSTDGVKRVMESEWTLNTEMEMHRILLPGLPDNNIPLDFVYIQPGTFRMGSPEGEICRGSSEIQHTVTLTKPFYLSKYETTNAQWYALMGRRSDKDDIPVDKITFQSIQSYLLKLNGLGLGIFLLPTEAEWEYACRAGTTTRYYWGEDELGSDGKMKRMCYYVSASTKTFFPVGLKLPNAWGLFDMSGNVYERCQDWFGQYISKEQIDPTGPSSGINYVCRGGGAYYCDVRSAKRYFQSTTSRNDYGIGLRLVWEPVLGMGE
ncbi:MAG: formylglycine-generating enzyme family protein [Candidatus Omnitrophota bacterium]